MPGTNDFAVFARSGHTNQLGKLTRDVGHLVLPEDVGQIIAERAHEEGMPIIEYVRLLCAISAFGADHIAKIHAERLRRMAGIRNESGHATDTGGTKP